MLPGENDNYLHVYSLDNIDGACMCVCVWIVVCCWCRWIIVLLHLILAQYKKQRASIQRKKINKKASSGWRCVYLLFMLGSGYYMTSCLQLLCCLCCCEKGHTLCFEYTNISTSLLPHVCTSFVMGLCNFGYYVPFDNLLRASVYVLTHGVQMCVMGRGQQTVLDYICFARDRIWDIQSARNCISQFLMF